MHGYEPKIRSFRGATPSHGNVKECTMLTGLPFTQRGPPYAREECTALDNPMSLLGSRPGRCTPRFTLRALVKQCFRPLWTKWIAEGAEENLGLQVDQASSAAAVQIV